MTPQTLIDRINSKVSKPAQYRSPSHFYNSMRLHYNPAWTWPKPNDTLEWDWLYEYGVEHAKQKEVMQKVEE